MWHIIIGASFAALAGWTVNDWRHDAQLKNALEAAQEAAQIDIDALQLKLDTANEDRLKLSSELAAEQANIKIKYRTITQKVPEYVPQNTDTCNCDIGHELVGLLNAAAGGGLRYQGSNDITARQLLNALPEEPTDLAGGNER